jgi:hypothetical protein
MIQRTSPDWRPTRAKLEEWIEAARIELEDAGCEPRRADQLRGEIAAHRRFIEEVEPSLDPPTKQVSYS